MFECSTDILTVKLKVFLLKHELKVSQCLSVCPCSISLSKAQNPLLFGLDLALSCDPGVSDMFNTGFLFSHHHYALQYEDAPQDPTPQITNGHISLCLNNNMGILRTSWYYCTQNSSALLCSKPLVLPPTYLPC